VLRGQSISLSRQSRALYNQSIRGVEQCTNTLNKEVLYFFKNKNASLGHIQKNVKNLDPKNVLKRGFSITLANNKSITHFDEVKSGDKIKTILYNGQLISEIKSAQKPEDHE
jgi:exodeoxyribonuclease VII large subunit